VQQNGIETPHTHRDALVLLFRCRWRLPFVTVLLLSFLCLNTGFAGATGPLGPSGFPGPHGFTGHTGLPGGRGDPGFQGPVGSTGATGQPGSTGSPGGFGAPGNEFSDICIQLYFIILYGSTK